MAELFLELFSEEIPAKLQIDARNKIKQRINESLEKNEINFKSSQSFSTPKRLVFLIDGIPEKLEQSKKIIRGPRIDAPQSALDGFIKSNNLNKLNIYKKKIEKGEFYFAETKPKTINILDELKKILPEILNGYSWKKSMKWSNYDLSWGRPLKSILALFNNKVINLSPIERGDIEIIKGWRNSQKIQKYFREYRLFSIEQKERWYTSMVHDNRFEMFSIKDNASQEMVGVCGLTYIDWVNRHADVHIYVGKGDEWIDNEYCPEALKTILEYGFGILNLNKVWAEVYEIDNKKIKFFTDFGFSVDASLRQHYYYKGKYYDSHILSLLRGEYE